MLKPRFNRDIEPPTSNQLRLIARLTLALRIREPSVKSFGEAGRMIQELLRELEYRKLHSKKAVSK